MQHVYQNAVEATCPCLIPCCGSQQRLLIIMLEMHHFMGLASSESAYQNFFFWHLPSGQLFTNAHNNVAVSPWLLFVHAF